MSDIEAPNAPVACPVENCYLVVDLVLESSNGVRFWAHKMNLEQYSAGFPRAEATTSDNEVVKLPETDSVLRLLLQFMHNEQQPEISKLAFSELSLLAEVVEKYMVFSAMQVCRMHMEKRINIHPLEVFLYAIKHDYYALADEAAPSLIRTPFEAFVKHATLAGLPARAVVHFIRYRERWSNVLNILYEDLPVVLHRGGQKTCGQWAEFYNEILLGVKMDPSSLPQFSDTVEEHRDTLDNCTHCWIKVGRLKQKIAEGISAIPRFSQI